MSGTVAANNTIVRLNADELPDPSGGTYWEIEEWRGANRTWYSIRHDGWAVAEVYRGSDGWRVAGTPRERIPHVVLAELPEAACQVLAPYSCTADAAFAA